MQEQVAQNLIDAGCENGIIDQFAQLDKRGRTEEQFRLLARHRISLLDIIHAYQKKLDCLDYLIYSMKKEQKEIPSKKIG